MQNYVKKLYQKNDINSIANYSITEIADIFNIPLFYYHRSFKIIIDDYYLICINKNNPTYIQREEFFHELSHILLSHHNVKRNLLDLEYSADYLAFFLAVPLHEILNLDNEELNIYSLSEMYKVSHEFILSCINIYKSKKAS